MIDWYKWTALRWNAKAQRTLEWTEWLLFFAHYIYSFIATLPHCFLTLLRRDFLWRQRIFFASVRYFLMVCALLSAFRRQHVAAFGFLSLQLTFSCVLMFKRSKVWLGARVAWLGWLALCIFASIVLITSLVLHSLLLLFCSFFRRRIALSSSFIFSFIALPDLPSVYLLSVALLQNVCSFQSTQFFLIFFSSPLFSCLLLLLLNALASVSICLCFCFVSSFLCCLRWWICYFVHFPFLLSCFLSSFPLSFSLPCLAFFAVHCFVSFFHFLPTRWCFDSLAECGTLCSACAELPWLLCLALLAVGWTLSSHVTSDQIRWTDYGNQNKSLQC